MTRRTRSACVTLVLAALLGAVRANAQRPTPPRAGAVETAPPTLRPSETNPLQCWWRTSAGAVRIGEVFDVTLTCAALDTDALRAVPDQTRLTVAAIQLAPFEIVEGGAAPELRQDGQRILQHSYRLRLINPDVIGRDVKLPPLAIPYRVESRVGAGATLAGRDLVHQMPQIAIRVVSQVAADAEDIRDSGDASLARIDALRFRATAVRVAAWVLMLVAAALAVGALAPALSVLRRRKTRGARGLADRTVLGLAARVLDQRLGEARDTGWTPEGLAEAHVAARVVAAVACGTGARELRLGRGVATPAGRLRLTRRFGREEAAVTTHVTSQHLTTALAALPAEASSATRSRLERLRDGLAALTRARYGAAVPESAAASVDEALAAARDIAREMARERLWSPREWFRRPAASATSALEF
jgi:hypothetical protein